MTGPNQRVIPVQIQKAVGGVNVSFSATTVGEHVIDIQVKNQRLSGAPFRYVTYTQEFIRFLFFDFCLPFFFFLVVTCGCVREGLEK